MRTDVVVSPRKQPKQARSRATVDAILEAAARVLVQEGYDDATTNRIAEVAGVSIGSLYQYYPNKESLVAALACRHGETMLATLAEGLSHFATMPLYDAVRDIVDRIISTNAQNPTLYRLLMEQVPRDGKLAQAYNIDSRFHEIAIAALRSRGDELDFPDLERSAYLIAETLEALTHGAVLRNPTLFTDERYAEEVTHMLVRYMHPRNN